jgi:coproporphyrinogen III oxidase
MAFTKAVGNGILPSWLPIAQRRASLAFSGPQRDWQELRRGRYIEFNLLYDRGVKFGLDGGRIESIMVSAPPRVQWQYMRSSTPAAGGPEEEMLQVLRAPIAWV